MFAAFNVSARNLYYFVGKRDGDNANVADYRAYCQTFKRGSIDRVDKILRDLNAQCLHMGRKRTKEVEKKVNSDRIREISKWVVANMDNLLKNFNDDFRSKLKPEWADLLSKRRIVAVLVPSGPSACSVTSVMTTSPTGMGQPIQFEAAPKK